MSAWGTPDYLAIVRQAEARLMAEGKIRVQPGSAPTINPAVSEARYRALLRRAYALAGDDAASPVECTGLLGELGKATDDLGPTRATALRHEEAGRYWEQTGRCPWCGSTERFHTCEEMAA